MLKRFGSHFRFTGRGSIAPFVLGVLPIVAIASLGLFAAQASAAVTAAKVTVGSPPDHTPKNHVNEPAVAIDAHNPDVLVAGGIDFIDHQDCPQTIATQEARCLRNMQHGVGNSAVYFSFDRGKTWTQPTYTGWTRRDCPSDDVCDGYFGPIGTLPWYYEAGLVTNGDPAVAIGPRRANGRFSWANGSRVYYGNLTYNFPDQSTITGDYLKIAVSRLDNPTPSRVAKKSSWMAPVLVSGNRRATTEDKVQIWADNAASSPHFGNVYACWGDFRSNGGGNGVPLPMMVGTSTDGGTSWSVRQVTAADASGHGANKWGQLGCTIRTDSHGVVYVFAERSENPALSGLPIPAEHVLIRSFDGGHTWSKGRAIFPTTVPCHFEDPLSLSCVMDGYTGARTGLGAAPAVDIANGAPTGADATNLIIDAWSDASAGLNNEQARVSWSTDGGNSWHDPVAVQLPGDRPLYAAPALSPAGDRAYVVYEAVTSPWRGADMGSPRPYHGVFLTAPVGPGGPGAWTTLYDGPFGDVRASYPGHRLNQERVGDYVYAAASRDYGVGVWIDVRDAAVCQAIQDWRGDSIAAGRTLIPAPWPLADCPPTFGNTDVWSATTG